MLKVKLVVREASFEIEGDTLEPSEAVLALVHAWARAVSPDPLQTEVDALARRAKTLADDLTTARAGNTPQEET